MIFSLLSISALNAECKSLAQATGAAGHWKYFIEQYGEAKFPGELKVCTGNRYFHELKGGAKMLSALDRKRGRILLRTGKLQHLMHELAHVYLDIRWKVLPYSVSEPFVLAMADNTKCDTTAISAEALGVRWSKRKELPRCELLTLLKDIFAADAKVRDSLLLQ